MSAVRRSITRKLARIVECTRLLDLSRGDTDFMATDGNEIIYVVDTNFIQAFLQPSAWKRCSRLFHDFGVWQPTAREKNWRQDFTTLEHSIAAQATCLATEFVFSLALKSQRRQVLMSQAHQEECEHQITLLEEKFFKHKNEVRSHQAEQAERIMKYIQMNPARDHLRESGALWTGDLDFAKMSDHEYSRAWKNYITASVCRIISDDDFTEPRDQVGRLASNDWHIGRLDWTFPVDPNSKELASQTEYWLDLLRKEHKRRGAQVAAADKQQASESKTVRLGRNANRTENSLRADASTLAYLTLISRRALNRQQRVVFITGDSLILNAYRRWYGHNGENVSYLMRPIALYGPQYNLKDADATLSKSLQAFEGARGALEAPTYWLTSILCDHYLPGEQNQRYAGARARDMFCSDAEDNAVPEDLFDELVPLSASSLKVAELESTAEQLRWLERVSMGAVPNLVRRRVDTAMERAQQFFDSAEEQPVSENGDVENYLSRRLGTAAESGFKFSGPYAVTWIKQALRSLRKEGPRVGAVLRSRLPFKPARDAAVISYTAPEWEARLREPISDASIQFALLYLAEQPARLFALASWLAFGQDRWSEAVRFAGFAERAAEDGGELYHECLYFKALSLRIRMMSEAPTSAREVDVWRNDMDNAIHVLKSCLDQLVDAHEVRRLRARAELVAARMSYCGWAAVGELGALNAYRHDPLDLSEIFSQACNDLIDCVKELRRHINPSDETRDADTAQQRDLRWVHTQLSLTTEYARLIYVCLTSRFDPHGRAYLPALRIWEQLRALKVDPPPERRRNAVLAAYDSSQRGRFAKTVGEAKAAAKEIKDLDREANLELDRSMLDLMMHVANKVWDIDDHEDSAWSASRWNEAVAAVVHDLHSQPSLFSAA